MSELGEIRAVVVSSEDPADLAQRVMLAIGEYGHEQDELHVSHAIAPEPSVDGLMRYTALVVLRPHTAAKRERSGRLTLSAQASMAIEELRLADKRWKAAIDASAQARTETGFDARLRNLGAAAEQEAISLRHADMAGLMWWADPDCRGMELSYELRRGALDRPGPRAMWERFDAAVLELGEALAESALEAIASAFAELSRVALDLGQELRPE